MTEWTKERIENEKHWYREDKAVLLMLNEIECLQGEQERLALENKELTEDVLELRRLLRSEGYARLSAYCKSTGLLLGDLPDLICDQDKAIRQAVEQERAMVREYMDDPCNQCGVACCEHWIQWIRNRSQETAVCNCGSKLAPNQVICLPCSLRNRSQEGR